MSLDHLQKLHGRIKKYLPRALENSDLRTIFDRVRQYLEQLQRSLTTSQQVYRNVFHRRSMATTSEQEYREILQPRSFTTNSWDFIHYVEAFWHLSADMPDLHFLPDMPICPERKFWTFLDNVVEFFKFKCNSLKKDKLIDTWNKEFTPKDREMLEFTVEQLTRLTNHVERVHKHANIHVQI